MSTHQLPARPNLEHLKKQARSLQRECLAADAQAQARFAACGIQAAQPKLADALHVIAREYGFQTWPALKLHIELASEDPVEALIAAIKTNGAALVEQVLTRHAALKGRIDEPLPNFGFEAPALHAAVHRENRAMVDVLLSAGANIDARSGWWAGSFGVLDLASPELSAYLISRGATLDIHSAARLGMIDRVRALLAHDPSLVHARGGDGQLPLHFAATIEMAELLLNHGAEMYVRDIDHESTAVQYMACIRPYRHEVATFLVSRGAEADILTAAALGDLALVRDLLDRDPDAVRTQVSEECFPRRNPRAGGIIYIFGLGWGSTPHMLARRFSHAAVFELLMQRSEPWLQLAQACEIHEETRARQIAAEHPRMLEQMSPNAVSRIVGAALRNNAQAVELLLAAGWPAAAVNEHKQSALHCAAWHGNLAMLTALIARNAPVNIFETEHGGTPLAWALHGSLNSWERETGDYPGVTRALIAAGAAIPKPERPLEATEEVLAVLRQQAP